MYVSKSKSYLTYLKDFLPVFVFFSVITVIKFLKNYIAGHYTNFLPFLCKVNNYPRKLLKYYEESRLNKTKVFDFYPIFC